MAVPLNYMTNDDKEFDEPTVGQMDLEDRTTLRRVDGLRTELEDITEVEYRQVRLEKVVIIGVYSRGHEIDAENSLKELAALCETAGAEVLDGLLQRKPNPDPATYLGRGKVEELAAIVLAEGADTVVADTELAPSQRRALEDAVKVKVIDRTAVILDIFAQHAKSREGKAQVELAQLQYLLPRLRGWGDSMSRQAGGQVGGQGAGMGSRGPGETKIEIDRRRIRTQMSKLRAQIKGFEPAREAKRANRIRNAIPSVAIMGYTNAGKSSLLNSITKAGVLVENALFATLDPTVRKTTTPDGRPYTLADTVGFVRQLPHQLVEAFRSTFEEVTMSDVIVHVVDASHEDPAQQIKTVRDVVGEVEARDIPEIIVFNKADLIDDDQQILLRGLEPNAVFVSAKTGEGVEALQQLIADTIPEPDVEVTAVIPYEHGEIVSMIHKSGHVLDTDYVESGTRIHARVSVEMAARIGQYIEH
jgi:GTP-binding protein HflX